MSIKIVKNITSENARAVAVEVVDKVGKGRKINLGEIIRDHGYSDSVSKSPAKVTRTKSYKNTILELLNSMQREAIQIVEIIGTKRNKASFRDLIDGMEKTVKGITLLQQSTPKNLGDEKPLPEDEKRLLLEVLSRNL